MSETEKEYYLEKMYELDCEIEDNDGVMRLKEINDEKGDLLYQKKKIVKQLVDINQKIKSLNEEIETLTEKSTKKILEAIEKQRWYFIKNRPDIILDIETGIIWPNLNKLKLTQKNVKEMRLFIKELVVDGYEEWKIPTREMLVEIINTGFPFYEEKKIKGLSKIYNSNEEVSDLTYKNCGEVFLYGEIIAGVLPYSDAIVPRKYEKTLKDNTEWEEERKDRLKLNLLIKNKLEPIFNEEEITEIYRKKYIEKVNYLDKVIEYEENNNK